MSINSVSSKTISCFIRPDRDIDHLISTFNESQITNLLGLPTEVWNEILTQLLWIDLKRAEGTCKQMLILSQAIFKARRQQWASACPEVSEWPMRHLIIQVWIQPLFFSQSVFVTVARIMGLERFRNLPEFQDDSLENVSQIKPKQMTAPLMKGTAGKIKFLAIRYQLIKTGHNEHAGRRLVMALCHESPLSIDKPIHVFYEGDTPFNNLTLLDETGHFFRTSLLPKLLLQGVLDLSPTEATLHTHLPDLRQIKLA
jgi:hypothetical protein